MIINSKFILGIQVKAAACFKNELKKRCRVFLFTVVSCFFFSFAFANNTLLKNGDFERVSGSVLDDWKISGKDPVVEATANGGFIRGAISAFLKSASDDPGVRANTEIRQPMDGIEPGKLYVLSFFARGGKDGQTVTAILDAWRPVGVHWFRQKEYALSMDWKKYSMEVRIPDAAEWDNRKLSLRIVIASGSAFLDDISVTAVVDAIATPVTRRNILENPGFDNGVNGWHVQAWHSKNELDQRRPEIDRKIFQGGSASVKLYENNLSLLSKLMPYQPNTAYTLSVYIRGEKCSGIGPKIFLLTPGWKGVNLQLSAGDLSEQWKRYSLSFQMPGFGSAYASSFYIRIDPNDSTVWIDSMQLEEGKLTDYDPGLQIGIEADNRFGIFNNKGEGVIKVHVTSSSPLSEPLRLSVSGNDCSGFENYSQTKHLNKGETDIRFQMKAPKNPLGVITINARLTPEDDTNAIRASADRRIIIADDISSIPKNPYIGMDFWPIRHPESRNNLLDELCSQFGYGFIRVFYKSGVKQPKAYQEQGQEHIALACQALKPLHDKGINTIVCIDPDIDSILSLRGQRNANRVPNEEEYKREITRYAEKIRTIAENCKGMFDCIEIFNEPNIWRIGGNATLPPDIYYRVLKETSAAVRAANGKMKLAANINGIDLEYTRKLFQFGAASCIDIFTIHPYRASPEMPPIYNDIKKLRELLDTYNINIPIINTEQYYGARDSRYLISSEFGASYFGDSEIESAGKTIQTFLHCIAADRVPVSLLQTHWTVFAQGISEQPYYYYTFWMLRVLGKHIRTIVQSESFDTIPDVRVFLFERKDGVKIVTMNTKTLGIQGTVKIASKHVSVYDPNGSQIESDAVAVGYFPVYFMFHKNVSQQEIKSIFKSSLYKGFDSAMSVQFDVVENKHVSLLLKNTDTVANSGSIKFISVPTIWSFPESLKFDMKPQEEVKYYFTMKPGTECLWNSENVVDYSVSTSDAIVNRQVKLPSIMIKKAIAPIVLDGSFSDWTDASWMELDEKAVSTTGSVSEIKHSGPGDLSAKIAFQWSEQGLYVGVIVKDNKVVKGSSSDPAFMWLADNLQFYFDLRNDSKKKIQAYDPNDVVYSIGFINETKPVAYLEKNPGTRFIGEQNQVTGIDGDISVGYKESEFGYNYELYFPAHVLPFLSFQSGSIFGLSLLINDNDGDGRKQGLTLGPQGTQPYMNPFIWRCVKLQR